MAQFYAAWSRVGEMLCSGAEMWKVVWIIWFKVDEMRPRLEEMWSWMHVKLYRFEKVWVCGEDDVV